MCFWLKRILFASLILITRNYFSFKWNLVPKHCLYSSLRTGHIPVSLAWVCCNRVSNISCKFDTSWRVAGTLETLHQQQSLSYNWKIKLHNKCVPFVTTIVHLLPNIVVVECHSKFLQSLYDCQPLFHPNSVSLHVLVFESCTEIFSELTAKLIQLLPYLQVSSCV